MRGHSFYQRGGIFLGLQQCRHIIHGVGSYGCSRGFQADVWIEPDIVIPRPPARFPCSPGKAHQLSRILLIKLIKHTQVSYVAQARPTCPGLETTHLGGRTQESARDVLDGQLVLIAQFT